MRFALKQPRQCSFNTARVRVFGLGHVIENVTSLVGGILPKPQPRQQVGRTQPDRESFWS